MQVFNMHITCWKKTCCGYCISTKLASVDSASVFHELQNEYVVRKSIRLVSYSILIIRQNGGGGVSANPNRVACITRVEASGWEKAFPGEATGLSKQGNCSILEKKKKLPPLNNGISNYRHWWNVVSHCWSALEKAKLKSNVLPIITIAQAWLNPSELKRLNLSLCKACPKLLPSNCEVK